MLDLTIPAMTLVCYCTKSTQISGMYCKPRLQVQAHTHLSAHPRQTPAPDAWHLSVKEAPRMSLQLWTCRSQMHLGSQWKTVCDFPQPVKQMTWWESWCGNKTGPVGSWDAGRVPLAAWLLAVAACWPGTWARRWCLPIPVQQLQGGNQNSIIMKGHWTSILPSK